MNKKLFVVGLVTILMSSAKALELECNAKYFNSEEIKVHLVASSGSESDLTDLTLTIDGEITREIKSTFGSAYNGRKYKNRIVYTMDSQATKRNKWEFSSLTLMLPEGWGEQGKFVGHIIERSSDGGKYNKIFCDTID